MSYFSSSSSSSSLSFSDPLSCNNYSYYSASPQPTPPLDYNQNHTYNSLNSSYSSSLPSNHFVMPKTSVFNPSSSSSSASSCEYYDINSSPIRRVFSTGDLQSMNGSRASPHESYAHETGTVAPKVGRYSAEDRKEKIARYRIKRNQRNFQKKITYACRKTLADSRPRVKGRFARNGENETDMEMEMIGTCYDTFGTGYENYSYNGNSYNNQILQNDCAGTSTSAVTGTGNEREWGKQEEINYDDVFWPNLVDIFTEFVR